MNKSAALTILERAKHMIKIEGKEVKLEEVKALLAIAVSRELIHLEELKLFIKKIDEKEFARIDKRYIRQTT